MSFFKPGPPSRKQIERRERTILKGRTHYIIFRGILGWGMPTFLLTEIWDWYYHGWRLAPWGKLSFQMLFGLVLWTTSGYWLGSYMWQRIIEEPARKST